MVGVLIVGALDLFRRGLREIVNRRRSWKVVAETDDGGAALGFALKHQPDLAIVDYYPPRIDAVDVTRQLRDCRPATEVLLCANDPPHAVLCDALRAGARGAVLKSDPEALLISAMEAVVRHKAFFSECIKRHKPAPTPADPEISGRLAPREMAVVKLIMAGCSYAEIADRLKLSHQTIASLHASALGKSGAISSPGSDRLADEGGQLSLWNRRH